MGGRVVLGGDIVLYSYMIFKLLDWIYTVALWSLIVSLMISIFFLSFTSHPSSYMNILEDLPESSFSSF